MKPYKFDNIDNIGLTDNIDNIDNKVGNIIIIINISGVIRG